jgi:hypothetical protein
MRLSPKTCGVVGLLLFASLVCAQAGPDGHWEGILKTERGDLNVSLDLQKNAKAQWIASMGLPPNLQGLVVTEVAVEGKAVKFTAAELMMTKFELTLEAPAVLKGTYTARQGSVPVEFKRTGDAKVELIPASAAVSKTLEGDWEGSLQMGSRAFAVLFHFKNQPDNTVGATIDTPDTKAMGLPLNDVKQDGNRVQVGIRIAHASFSGTLNENGTELAGQFTHEAQSAPLTLRKK